MVFFSSNENFRISIYYSLIGTHDASYIYVHLFTLIVLAMVVCSKV